MKTAVALCLLASLSTASPVFIGQEPFEYHTVEPGFSLDLNAQRLVQLEGQPPVWMSELDKVRIYRFSRTLTPHAFTDQGKGPRLQILRHVMLFISYLNPPLTPTRSTDTQDLQSFALGRIQGKSWFKSFSQFTLLTRGPRSLLSISERH